jgi:hypothetical protein
VTLLPNRKAPDTQPAKSASGALRKSLDMTISSTKRRARKSVPVNPDLFIWAESNSSSICPAIRAIMRRARVSAAVATVIAELSGFGGEATHG